MQARIAVRAELQAAGIGTAGVLSADLAAPPGRIVLRYRSRATTVVELNSRVWN